MADSYFDSFKTSYWNYYIELEKRMEATRKYVEYDEDNFRTYSGTYLMLMQAVNSEIDVVGKEIASHYDSSFDSEKGDKPINRWWFEIQDRLPGVKRSIKFADKFDLNPWENYRVVKKVSQRNSNGRVFSVTKYNLQPMTDGIIYSTPGWWTAYNKVKHKRVQSDGDGINYKKANLKNLASAFAALYLLEFEYMKDIGSINERVSCERSILFDMGDLVNCYIENFFTIIKDTD